MASRIEINGNVLEPTSQDSSGQSILSSPDIAESAADSNYILIQTKAPLNAIQKQALKDKEVVIHEYVSENTYLAGYEPESLEEIREGLKDFVVYADVYQPGFIVESGLKSGDDSEEQKVEIALHDDITDDDDVSRVAEDIAAKAGVPSDDVEIANGKATINVSKDKLEAIASIDEVKAINAAPERGFFNNVASGIMEVHKPTGTTQTIYRGKGQIVAVADTGIDTGDKDHIHSAFGNRVLATHTLGRTSGPADDPDGHGTHVSGSVAGNGTHSGEGKMESPASEGNLIVQSLFSGWSKPKVDPKTWSPQLGGIPTSIKNLFDPVYKQGARIHTNSWGGPPAAYSASRTGDLDKYLWDNQQLVVLFAAGNSGTDVDTNQGRVDPFSLGAEASAKNVITVGASESSRPDAIYPNGVLKYGLWPDDFKYAPIAGDPAANNPEGLAAFSSRGPTKPDGRIKPDVVAPGTSILSTRSSKIHPGHSSESWGKSTDAQWCYSGGTSMATPLTAGVVAVIRGALEDNGNKNPTASVVKAVLINGAVPLKGQYNQTGQNGEFGASPGRPNPNEGFGRVNLNNSLMHVVNTDKKTAGFGERTGDQGLGDDGRHDKEFSFSITVPRPGPGSGPASGRLTLKVTLVWPDPKGERLQNDLDLIVSDGHGKEKHGNMGDGQGFDRVNNVEQVVWKGVDHGAYKVTVRVNRTTFDPQPFAYAWWIH